MKFQSNVVYPNGEVKPVRNLGYMLRNWQQIEAIQVDTFKFEPGEKIAFCDAFMSVDFKDGRVYTTGFMDKEGLRRFLDRPIFHGLPICWFGKEEVIGKDW